ncbi:MAG: hypothetical protein JNM62_07140 [Flavobacteriales bacterium]|nr:hypothetical protein [Flavobacteriales bacterium]
MKKTILTTMLLATLTAVNAQESRPASKGTKDPAVMEQRANERAEKRTATMAQELGLNAGQTEEVKMINERFAKEVAQLKQAGGNEEARKARLKILKDTRDRDLQSVLTAEQFNKMLELRKAKKEGHDDDEVKAPHNE